MPRHVDQVVRFDHRRHIAIDKFTAVIVYDTGLNALHSLERGLEFDRHRLPVQASFPSNILFPLTPHPAQQRCPDQMYWEFDSHRGLSQPSRSSLPERLYRRIIAPKTTFIRPMSDKGLKGERKGRMS
jgi:hypothetical protein